MTHTVRNFNKAKIPNIGPVLHHTIRDCVIEIGAGVGFHAVRYSTAHPDHTYIAIEKTTNKFNRLQGRRSKHSQIENLIPIHANAVAWISHNIQPNSVDQYFILYPNPYPKDPQKRWFRMPFFSYLIETLKPQGLVTLATNQKFYYEEAKDFNNRHWRMQMVEDRLINQYEIPRTHFEKKYLQRGDFCWNLVFKK